MSALEPLPTPPPGVAYALTVPQSVIFADLSLRGSLPQVFQRVFHIDYHPRYVAVDDGAMSWDFSPADPFVQLLDPEVAPLKVASVFVEATGRTSRRLIRIATVVGPSARRRRGNASDLLQDLESYWNAYEDHMTSLYTFWNVENLLTDALVEELNRSGLHNEVEAGLPSFVRPSEQNWFAYEQENLAVLQRRFGATRTPEAQAAAQTHAEIFGFLLAPFNLGRPPDSDSVLARMETLRLTGNTRYDPIEEITWPDKVKALGAAERVLSFWKTERLDAFAQADQMVNELYLDLAGILGLPLDSIFAMTKTEITRAIGGDPIPETAIQVRKNAYCLALVNDEIKFFLPTPKSGSEATVAISGQVLKGFPASPGVVRGRVRIVMPGEIPELAGDEILVTQMTRPDMGAALDQALAYVTDEGGRLSHAAIVSREKHKPCVVAVGNATQLLRAGMLIEVDGAAGTVKVLDTSFLDRHS